MTKDQIGYHKSMKTKHPNYPRLPKFILKSKSPSYEKLDAYQESCLRGFYGRVSNWFKDWDYRVEQEELERLRKGN